MSKHQKKPIQFDNITQCLEAWTTLNEKGAVILSSINVDQQPKGDSQLLSDLNDILIGMRQVLEAMHELFDQISEKDEQFELYRQCINMFEQEFMVKESIQSIVQQSGFMSKQHLTGSISLWKAEAYLDEDVIKRLH
ncbi:uncharacterized protein BX664DRAFT_323992 [Halteromyces radiatus]|uniref:uncharacterized protein n=1 Tax=Halteromyces radiatus TaxID=101107 RepID=UPI002220A42A|nr:uncharacterized protein BX664DRAFT_323992 [Halteromyces radiatus]KAI8096434.1 hypothetical protein BX664DRAFT_323992 [Halteromyces radiatus]